MSLKFAICDDKQNITFWEKVKKYFENYLKEKIYIEFLESDNYKKIETEPFDIYYSAPDLLTSLDFKKFTPVAYTSEKRKIFLIKKRTKTLPSLPRILLPKNPLFLIPLIKFFKNITNVELWYVDNCEKILTLLWNEEIDITIICEENFQKIREKENFEILEKFDIPYNKVLVVSSSYQDGLKKALKNIPELFLIDPKEAELLISLYELIKYFSSFKELHNISYSLLNAPSIGVIIYGEKIFYANKYVQNLTGYTIEELQNMSIFDFLYEKENLANIKEVVKKRLSGEQFERIYIELKAKRKDGSVFYILAFTRTIVYENKYAGLVIFIDITQRKKIEKLYKVLKEINQLIITSLIEEELYQKICYTFVEELGLKFVWIGIPDKKEGIIKPVFKYGDEKNYLEKVKFSIFKDDSKIKNCVIKAYKEKKIIIFEDIRALPSTITWKEEMLKRGFLSAAAIPILKNNEVVAILVMYAEEPYFFGKDTLSLLTELQKDLGFALQRMKEFKNSMIIKTALENTDEWVLVTDADGNIVYANKAVSKISGFSIEELIGKNIKIFYSDYHSEEFYKNIWEIVNSGEIYSDIFVSKNKNGEYFYLDQKIIPVELPGGIKRFVAVGKDITRELGLSRELERLRYKDILTGLHNFNGFSLSVQDHLKIERNISLLVLIDIYGLSYLNQTYGLDFGNKVLKEVAQRLRNSFRKEDIIGRVGGDEFGIYARGLKRKEDAFFIHKKLQTLFEKPFSTNGLEINIKINGGVAIFPDDGRDFKNLYEHASIALLEAKKEGTNVIKFFNPSMEKKAKDLVWVVNLVEEAVKNNLFVFYYQPYFETQSLKIAGLEALVRIIDKKGKVYPPAEFINYLEKSPYLENFETWALQEIVNKIKKWKIPVSLNISANSLRRKDFIEDYLKKCKDLEIPLILELTERAVIENIEQARSIFERLKQYKIKLKIAIDDFGTGYSALVYLKDIPADYLKIDKSFIKELPKGPKEKAIVETIIHLAHSLNMKTIAEGVEKQDQLNILKELNCDFIQGFLLAKPMPEKEIEKNML